MKMAMKSMKTPIAKNKKIAYNIKDFIGKSNGNGNSKNK